MNVLLVEDDMTLGNGVRIALGDQGMSVVWVRRMEDAARAVAAGDCDLMVLDLGLPDGDGLSLLSSLRHDGHSLPVLILTARDSLDDRLRGLDGGADDYLVKPFALAELVSRLRALARRSANSDSATTELRGLRVHESPQCVIVEGHTVGLSRSEYRLLTAMLKRPDRVLTRRALEEQVLPSGIANESNVLDVHISNLRRKIGQGYIRTVRGVGYVIDSLPSREAGRK